MTMTPKNSGRFDDISSWMLEQIGLARFVKECNEAARSLLDDAERELSGLCADFTSAKLVKTPPQEPVQIEEAAVPPEPIANATTVLEPKLLPEKLAHVVPEHATVC
ncbi:MAG: hypothetical protein AAFR75_11405 [Pseudomonadota bacterium]